MLEMNPKDRWTASECLRDPYFNSVRCKPLERESTVSLQLPLDEPNVFDYHAGKNMKYDKVELKRMLFNICQEFREDRLS